MKVFVATYEHRHGADIQVFATGAGAEQYRQTIASEWWDDEMKGDTEKPTNPEELADVYFDYMIDRDRGEFFSVEECEVAGMPATTPLRLAVIIDGGICQGVCSDDPVLIGADYTVIDYDTDGALGMNGIKRDDGSIKNAFVGYGEIDRAAITILEAAPTGMEEG